MDTEVQVSSGRLKGVATLNCYGERFLAFRGIPYARPPIGYLRFQDPQPPVSWDGVRDASKFGNVCAHLDLMELNIKGSDDCLYLNVYTPSIDVSKKRAVMVWIHGGSFVFGSGNDTLYGPDHLIRKDVVLVTFNYRLGALGFLNLQDAVAPGNQGLKDQVMALKWVRENIANFSGDPGNVTIFGESAGGACVHYLTISPMAEGLFHRAITSSGVAVSSWAKEVVDPKRRAVQLAAKLGLKSFDPWTIIEFLRTVDVHKMIWAQNHLLTKEEHLATYSVFLPTVDDKSSNPFLPEPVATAMQKGVRVPLMIGFNDNEGSFLLRNHLKAYKPLFEKMNTNFELLFTDDVVETLRKDGITLKQLKEFYFGNGPITADMKQEYADLISDMTIQRGIYDVIKLQCEKGLSPTYFYYFTYDMKDSFMKGLAGVDLPGATHGDDIQFLFFPYILKANGVGPPKVGSMEYKVTDRLTQMWTDFAKTGNPTPKKTDLITTLWKPLQNTDVYDYLKISEDLSMEFVKKGEMRCEWKRLKNT